MENYTFEDYLKDFEFDYLGFDGVPDKPGSDPGSVQSTGNERKTEADDLSEDLPAPGLR